MNETATEMTSANEELQGLVQAARDSMTDDMVARLASTFTGIVDLMDKVDRSGLGDAIPALSKMVESGDLERLADLARVFSSAQDAMTDDMVARLADTASSSVDLLDQINRAGLSGAIPALAKMVNNGDLERIADLARVVSSAQDAMTDDMVNRLAETFGNGLCLLDRMCRYGGIDRMINLLEQLETAGLLERLAYTLPAVLYRLDHLEEFLKAMDKASAAMDEGVSAAGGFKGMWTMIRDKDNQEVMRYLFALGKELKSK